MNSYLILFVVVLIAAGLVAKKAENNPILYFFSVMILINTIFPFWLLFNETMFPFFFLNFIFAPMALISASTKRFSQNKEKEDEKELGNVFNDENETDNSEGSGNINNGYEEEFMGNTESVFEQAAFSKKANNSEVDFKGRSAIEEKSLIKEINQIGYDKRPEKVETRSDERIVESWKFKENSTAE